MKKTKKVLALLMALSIIFGNSKMAFADSPNIYSSAVDTNSQATKDEGKKDGSETQSANYVAEDFAVVLGEGLVSSMTMQGQEKNKKLGPDVEMEFPAKSKDGEPIKGIEEGAFNEREDENINVKKIILPEGYESIGDEALVGSNIKEVIAPSTLKKIGSGAFDKDTVIIFKSKEAMKACQNKSNATLKLMDEPAAEEPGEDLPKEGGTEAQSANYVAEDFAVVLGEGLVSSMTMQGQEKNKKLGPDVEMEFPAKSKDGEPIKGIEEGAFNEREYENVNVKKIILPEGYESIGEGALVGSNIKEVIAPSTLKKIGSGAFDKDTVIIFKSKEAMEACQNKSNAKLKLMDEPAAEEPGEDLSKDNVAFEIEDNSIPSMKFRVKLTAKKDVDLIENVESVWEYNFGYHTLIWDMIKKEDLVRYENKTFQEVKDMKVNPHYSMGGEIDENVKLHNKILDWIEKNKKSKDKDDIASKRAELLKLINTERNTIGSNVNKDYKEDSFKKYESKINEAENAVYNKSIEKSKLDEYIKEVPKYKDSLVLSGVNKTRLENMIKKADAEDGKKYASPTFKILQDELKYAKNVLKDDKAVQKVIDEAFSRLELALNNLFELKDGAVEEKINIKVVMYGTESEPSMANEGIKHDLVRVTKDGKATYFFICKPAGMMGAKSDVDGIKDYKTKVPATKIVLDPQSNDGYNRMFILTLDKSDSNRFDVEFGAKMGGEEVVYQPATIVIEKVTQEIRNEDGEIKDGRYIVPLHARHFYDRNKESMAKRGLPKEVEVIVNKGITKIILPIKAIPVKNLRGHLENMWLYNNEEDAKARKNQVLLKPQKTYIDDGKEYPGLYEIEVKGKVPSDIFIQVKVDAMGEVKPNAILSLDWSKARIKVGNSSLDTPSETDKVNNVASNIGGLKKVKKGPNTSDSFRLEFVALTLAISVFLVFKLRKLKMKDKMYKIN